MIPSSSQEPKSEVRKLYDCLQGLHFLHRLKLEELEKLLSVMKKRTVPAGATIFKQGDQADAFYLISTGKVGIWQKKTFKPRVKVAGLGEEEFFGENSLLNDARRSSDAIAETACELFVLHKADFDRILMGNAEIAQKIRAHAAEIRAQLRH